MSRGPSLWELTAEAMEWLRLAEEAESNADPRLAQEAEESLRLLLTEDLPRKVDAYGEVLSALEAQAGACRAEEVRLAERRRALDARRDRLKARLLDAMDALGLDRVEGALRTAVACDSTPAADVLDEDALPAEFMVSTTTTRPDKAALVKALVRGETVPGAALVRGRHVRLR